MGFHSYGLYPIIRMETKPLLAELSHVHLRRWSQIALMLLFFFFFFFWSGVCACICVSHVCLGTEYTHVCRFMSVYVCAHVQMCSREQKTVVHSLRSAMFFLWHRICHCPGGYQLGWICWPVTLRDPHVSNSPMLQFQVCDHASCLKKYFN